MKDFAPGGVLTTLPGEVSFMLNEIAEKQQEESIELPRLTVTNAFGTFHNMMTALTSARDQAAELPTLFNQTSVTDRLKSVIKLSEAAIKHATRLMEANK